MLYFSFDTPVLYLNCSKKPPLYFPFHDLMNIPHNIVIEYNGWSEKVYPDVPMVLLTTLDQNTDAKQKTASDLESKS